MNDRAVNLLEQYDVEVLKTRKGRGAILCDTSRGCLIFKEYTGNEERLAAQNRLLAYLQQFHDILVESILPNRDGKLFVKDHEGVMYILKTYMEGRECNINDREECLESVRMLAKLHSDMEFESESAVMLPWMSCPVEENSRRYFFSPGMEYEKRNRELKKVRRYLKQRSQKTWFEICLQQHFDAFLEQAFTLSREWAQYEDREEKER